MVLPESCTNYLLRLEAEDIIVVLGRKEDMERMEQVL